MREILSVGQPCILCEALTEVWIYERDEETGAERITTEPVPHECAAMQALQKERVASRRL